MQSLYAEYLMVLSGDLIGSGSETAAEFAKTFGMNMATDGTCLHMLNHALIKLVLFMIAGLIFMHVGSYDLNQVRGFGRRKPFLFVTFLLAAAGVGGIPLLNGYVSKTLLHESIAEYGELLAAAGSSMALSATPAMIKAVEALFLFSGGLTIAYMTKLFVVLFVEKNSDKKVQEAYDAKGEYASLMTKAAIGVCALPIPLIGLLPNLVAEAGCGVWAGALWPE